MSLGEDVAGCTASGWLKLIQGGGCEGKMLRIECRQDGDCLVYGLFFKKDDNYWPCSNSYR